jgi:hypothetical protein
MLELVPVDADVDEAKYSAHGVGPSGSHDDTVAEDFDAIFWFGFPLLEKRNDRVIPFMTET